MYKSILRTRVFLLLIVLVLPACNYIPVAEQAANETEILTIYPDGSMWLRNRSIPHEDVVIYPDGYGGEKAAIKVRLEPLHPSFYRDSIIVRRLDTRTVADND